MIATKTWQTIGPMKDKVLQTTEGLVMHDTLTLEPAAT